MSMTGPAVGPQDNAHPVGTQYTVPKVAPAPPMPFNDFPHYVYAGFWLRLCAFLLDLLVFVAVKHLTLDLIFRLGGWERGGLLSVYGLLSIAIYLGYFTLMTKLNHGQTLGKMIFGIAVVSLTEPVMSWSTALVREGAGRFILHYPLAFFGYLPAAFSKKKQQIADMFADTAVVKLDTVRALQEK
ncbi:RDD family protein [Enterococcus canis]|uniref:RDD family protein n=1 Tax=Enterococcus canis TaxID=214095 RepID=A0A1L8RIX1_9ENTE|nr:RDD family protein [Enterococcus canis]OJG19664.1 RDD family protein [Enterococcus canis]